MHIVQAEAEEGPVSTARRACLALALSLAVAGATSSGIMVGGTPPPLSVARWYNAPAPLTLEKLHGHVVLLDFWGVWCTPCREQMPTLVQLQNQFAARGFKILMVHTPQGADRLERYLRTERVPLVVALDTGETAQAYGVENYPSYVLIDARGRIVAFPEHPPEPRVIERLLQNAVERK